MRMHVLGGAVAALLLVPSMASAQAPAQIPLQGQLTSSEGEPITGERTVLFAIYDVEIGGSPVFSETQTVSVDSGFFTAYMGDVGELDLAAFRDNSVLYVELTVDDETLSPRMQLATTPYAAYAEYAGSVPFSGVTDAPSGLADGDDDTTYSAGAGLSLSGTTFSVDDAQFQRRVAGACPAGQAVSGIAVDGSPTCVALTTVDPATVQTRVSGSCPAGQAIRAISQTGEVTCEVDDDAGGDITEIRNGTAGVLTLSDCTTGVCTIGFDATDLFSIDPIEVVTDSDTNVNPGVVGTLTSVVVVSGDEPGEVALIGLADLDCQNDGCIAGLTRGTMGWATTDTDTTLDGQTSEVATSDSAAGDLLYSLATYEIPANTTRRYYLRGQCGGPDTCSYEAIQAMAIFIPN